MHLSTRVHLELEVCASQGQNLVQNSKEFEGVFFLKELCFNETIYIFFLRGDVVERGEKSMGNKM